MTFLVDLGQTAFVMLLASCLLRMTDYRKRWPRWYWYPYFFLCGLLSVGLSRGLT